MADRKRARRVDGNGGAHASNGAPSDDDLLAMLAEVEGAEETAAHAFPEIEETSADAQDDPLGGEPPPVHDPCLFCGVPAENVGECFSCGGAGCLPPDLWSPGMEDPCLTLCVRCARSIHLSCSVEDAAGNPCCPTCKF